MIWLSYSKERGLFLTGLIQNLPEKDWFSNKYSYIWAKARRYTAFAMKNIQASLTFFARLSLSLQYPIWWCRGAFGSDAAFLLKASCLCRIAVPAVTGAFIIDVQQRCMQNYQKRVVVYHFITPHLLKQDKHCLPGFSPLGYTAYQKHPYRSCGAQANSSPTLINSHRLCPFGSHCDHAPHLPTARQEWGHRCPVYWRTT